MTAAHDRGGRTITPRTVDDLARLAAGVQPPALDDVAARRLVERALASAPPAVAASPSRPPRVAWIVAAGAFAVAAIAALWLRPSGGVPEPLHVSLPTGDRLVGLDGARFDVAAVEPAHRRVHLHRGTVLADVARVAPGQRFEVATAHLVATAIGTVFSVDTDGQRSIVQVYEGSVDVMQDGAHQVVTAGASWSSADRAVEHVAERPRALIPAIDEAVGRHVADATRPAPAPNPEPRIADKVAVSPSPASPTAVSPTPRDDVAVSSPSPASPTAGSPTPASPTAVSPTPRENVVSPSPAPPREEPATASPAPATADSLDVLLLRARGEIAANRLEQALEIAKQAAARGGVKGAWRLVTADALRGLGRASEAADAFELAAYELTGADAYEAGFTAAYLLFKEVQSPQRALEVLDRTAVDAASSPLEERGLVLRVRILDRLGRRAEARPYAERYLARYPNGGGRIVMQTLLK